VLSKPNALTAANLTLTRFSSRQPDRDNLMSSWKAVIDGLVESGVLVDDNCDVVKSIDSRWEKASSKNSKIRVLVEEVIL
jgi:Holliday junction resolvase RusA-like endonuclease